MRKQEMFKRYLESKGYNQDLLTRVSRYIVMAKSGSSDKTRYFLGKMGAVRKGTTVTDSISLNIDWERVEQFLKGAEK